MCPGRISSWLQGKGFEAYKLSVELGQSGLTCVVENEHSVDHVVAIGGTRVKVYNSKSPYTDLDLERPKRRC